MYAELQTTFPEIFADARNLAFHVIKTPWALCADIDHMVSANALNAITSLDLSDKDIVYSVARQRTCPAQSILLSIQPVQRLLNRRPNHLVQMRLNATLVDLPCRSRSRLHPAACINSCFHGWLHSPRLRGSLLLLVPNPKH